MKVARCACARQLVHIAYAVATPECAFDPNYQPATRGEVARASPAEQHEETGRLFSSSRGLASSSPHTHSAVTHREPLAGWERREPALRASGVSELRHQGGAC